MDPATVLAALAALGGRLPAAHARSSAARSPTPATGMGLTPPVAAAVDEAVRAVRDLVGRTLRPAEVG